VRRTWAVQSLSYLRRLSDPLQADALWLLNVSKAVISTALVALCPHLDEFGERGDGPSWKQVEGILTSPDPHGSRQRSCQAEQVGPILRAQVHRSGCSSRRTPIIFRQD
jgi:hypothetical protein